MAVPFAAIATLGEVRDYAKGAAAAAASKCPKAAADYAGLHQEIVGYIIGNQLHPGEMVGVAAFKSDILAIRKKCKTEQGAGTKKQGTKVVKKGEISIDLGPGYVITPKKAGIGIGAVLLGLLGGYLLLSKKK